LKASKSSKFMAIEHVCDDALEVLAQGWHQHRTAPVS